MMAQNKEYKLTNSEKTTTTAYKMMSEKINSLEQSLRKTQDAHEDERQKNHELDKKVVVLENRLKNNRLVEVFKFLSSLGVGFSINYITNGNYHFGVPIFIASVVIYFVCIKLG